jgi:adenosylcobinamide-GDP ribazoletransferase
MPFFTAIEFLTRIRLRRTAPADLDAIARSQAWFAIVGLAIGGLLVAIDRLAIKALPATSVDVLLVVALAAITGALHLDGLADAADGLFGGRDPAHRLEIMHDVHAGSFAIVAIAGVLALKWAGLAALQANVRVETLLLAPCVARFAMVVTIAAFPYARAEGMGTTFHERAWPLALAACATTALIAGVVLLGPGGLFVVAFAAACALAFGAYATRLVGGMTGDLYGASVEITEAATLLFVAALANRGWIDAWVLR